LAGNTGEPEDVSPISSPPTSSEESAGLPGPNLAAPTTIVRMLGGTIAWLSGAAVGIGAIFYVCGVLVTIANLDMLGLDPLIFRYDAAFYMHRGGLFLLEFATEAGQFFFQAIPLVGVLLLLAAPLRKHRTMSV
jgi:hypothetical protein